MNQNIVKIFFQCERCDYKTNLSSDMQQHLNRKKICINNKKDLIISESEFKNRSLKKKYENSEEVLKTYNDLKKKENEEKEKDSSLYWKDIDKRCEYCFNIFYQKSNLDKHIKKCKIKEFIESNNSNTNTTINNNQNIINTTNINSNNLTQNITNINVNLDNKCIDKLLIPFYDKFDTSHISNETQLDLLLSTMYEDTLKEILKNDLNLNFILDNTTDNKSYVYKGDEKVERIDNEEIYNKIWLEVKNYLIESLNKIKIEKKRYEKQIIRFIEDTIKEKHKFLTCNNEDTVNNVKDVIKNVSKENEEKTILKFKQISYDLLKDGI